MADTSQTSPDDLQADGDHAAGPSSASTPTAAPSSSETAGDGAALHEFSAGLSVDSDNRDNISDLDDLNATCVPPRKKKRTTLQPPCVPDTSRASSKTASSTIYQFVEQFGRTFHRYKEGKYLLPNDERERNRLDLQHYLSSRLLQGQLYTAPLETVHRALDIGTGTGIWAMEFAEQHPEADVLGNDLSPIQPEYVAPNVHFEIDDIEDEWLYSAPFDYIHGRCILPSLRDLPTLMRRIYDNLQPGGYVEFMEMLMVIEAIDDSLANTVLPHWHWLITEGVRRIGREPMLPLHTRQLLEDAGFVNIVEKKFAVPINPWARGDEQKVRGALMLANLLDACESITMTVCRLVWGWSLEQVEALLVDIRASLKNRNIHAYVPFLVVYAQKPKEAAA